MVLIYQGTAESSSVECEEIYFMLCIIQNVFFFLFFKHIFLRL